MLDFFHIVHILLMKIIDSLWGVAVPSLLIDFTARA
jgi:hypothetical protein